MNLPFGALYIPDKIPLKTGSRKLIESSSAQPRLGLWCWKVENWPNLLQFSAFTLIGIVSPKITQPQIVGFCQNSVCERVMDARWQVKFMVGQRPNFQFLYHYNLAADCSISLKFGT